MLDCSACIQRCIRTIFSDINVTAAPPALISRASPRHLRSYNTPSRRTSRRYATETFQQPPVTQGIPADLVPSQSPDGDIEDAPTSRSPVPERLYSESNLKRELVWLADPLRLAQEVVKLLKLDSDQGYAKAEGLVRLASKQMACTVSWNHLIDYDMSKGSVKHALKHYQEMKKRAQTPDAYTFMTLFRGFSWNTRYPKTLEQTLSIYHSMFADTSPVKPSIAHTNAVLKVCAFTGDIDAMFGVAARLPTKGKGAPDTLTFTVIVNAIRNKAREDTKGQPVTASLVERQGAAVMQGRRIWGEIRDRWVAGDLHLDEELVCAVGRLLLTGRTNQDSDDILSLVEMTMGIPRQIPRLGDPARKTYVEQQKAMRTSTAENPDDNLETLMPPEEAAEEDEETTHTPTAESRLAQQDAESLNPFAPLSTFLPEQYRIRPGQNTLSLVLEACTSLRLYRPAQDYWGLLTSPNHYNIIPDQANYHVYLRLLRLQRASKLSLEIVEEMAKGTLVAPAKQQRPGRRSAAPPTPPVQVKTFRIALSTCVRDKMNPNALGYAQRLVGIMTDTLEDPDPQCLISLLSVALAGGGREPAARDWRVLMSVVRGQEANLRSIRSMIAYKTFAPEIKRRREERVGEEAVVIELMRLIVSVLDQVMGLGREMMSSKEKGECMEQKNRIMALITRRMGTQKGLHRKAKERGIVRDEVATGADDLPERKGYTPRFERSGSGHVESI